MHLSAQSATDAGAPLRTAIEKTQANSRQAMGFTYDIARLNRNFTPEGKLIVEDTAKYDVVFVQGMPYRRLLEEDGKPLSGKAAAEEVRRYRLAFDERSHMTIDQKRSYLRRLRNVDIPLPLLPTLFSCRVTGEEEIAGRKTIVMECDPRDDVHSSDEEEIRAMRKRVRLWIDRDDLIVSRMEATLLEEDAGLGPGTVARIDFSPVDGVWVPIRSDVEFNTKVKLEPIRGQTIETNSGFKRFHVDVRLLDGGSMVQGCDPKQ